MRDGMPFNWTLALFWAFRGAVGVAASSAVTIV